MLHVNPEERSYIAGLEEVKGLLGDLTTIPEESGNRTISYSDPDDGSIPAGGAMPRYPVMFASAVHPDAQLELDRELSAYPAGLPEFIGSMPFQGA